MASVLELQVLTVSVKDVTACNVCTRVCWRLITAQQPAAYIGTTAQRHTWDSWRDTSTLSLYTRCRAYENHSGPIFGLVVPKDQRDQVVWL